jgi:hypothetical protein
MNVQIAVLFPSDRKTAGFMLVACAFNFTLVKNQIAISTSSRPMTMARIHKAKRQWQKLPTLVINVFVFTLLRMAFFHLENVEN